MPRRARVESPGGFFHVAARAVDGASVYREAHDRTTFIAFLHRAAVTYDWRCQAYCLMGTHFHLVIQTIRPTLSRGMQRLCGGYAQWFNKRHARKGHLFGSRFLAVAIESDRHLLEAHRYLARNPQVAGLCDRPSRWRWSSYRATLDLEPPLAFLDIAGVLELFDHRPVIAREQFRRFVEEVRVSETSEKYALAKTDGV